ncbi:MAG: glycogen debranching N-terminal domain-containing protein, partial [Acidimicrobiia bacterium]
MVDPSEAWFLGRPPDNGTPLPVGWPHGLQSDTLRCARRRASSPRVRRVTVTQPWTYEGAVASNPGATVTLTGETTFCLSAANGDILPGSAQGLFFLDTRFLSQLELFVDGHPTESLAQSDEQPYEGLFVVRPTGGTSLDPAVLVFRRRVVGRGMVERIELRNYGREPAVVSVELAIGADFADLFEVKEQRAQHPLEHSVTETPMGMRFVGLPNGIPRRTTVRSTPPPDH